MEYMIIEIDGKIRAPINKKGQSSRYEEPKKFDSISKAKQWIEKHTYKGMSYKYEVTTWRY